MRKFLLSIILLLIAVTGIAGDFLNYPSYTNFPTKSGFSTNAWWNTADLLFWAPFDDPANPLRLLKGSNAISFSRVNDATHTASYVSASTGVVTVASSNQARIESRGILIEESRINHMLWSEQLDHVGWSFVAIKAFGGGSVANAIVGPDGAQSMDLITEDGTNTYHVAYQTLAGVADGSTVVGSVYAKAGTRTWALIILNTAGGLKNAWFNIATGVVGSKDAGVTSGIEAGPMGTYRIWASVDVGVISGNAQMFFGGVPADSTTTFQGDDASGMYFWGANLEVGTFLTSYIPTGATTMTRNVELVTFKSSGNILNTKGTVAFSFDTEYTSNFRTIIVNTSATEWIAIMNTGTSNLGVFIGSFKSGVSGALSTNKGATTWDGTNVNAASNAVAGTPAAGQFAAFDADLSVGEFSGTLNLNGHIKNLRIWNRSFSSAELQSITQ